MLYLIYAADGIYGGLHGMHSYEVWDCNEKEAIEIAIENSQSIISDYGCIYEELEATIEDNIDETMSEADIEELRYDIYTEDLEYEVYKIDENKVNENNLTIEDLEEMVNYDPESFLEEYIIL
jgi:N-methylhydantoinase A/oxoprolinase/acetone carboxylase beta subunit